MQDREAITYTFATSLYYSRPYIARKNQACCHEQNDIASSSVIFQYKLSLCWSRKQTDTEQNTVIKLLQFCLDFEFKKRHPIHYEWAMECV